MNHRLASIAKDCVKFSLFAVVPGVLGGLAHDWWVGFKLWFGFTLVFAAAMLWIGRRDLLALIRRR